MLFSAVLPNGKNFWLHAVHFFEPEIRRQIHRAKIGNRPPILSEIVVTHIDSLSFLREVSSKPLSLAAPSSLWGRLRGRFDIAAEIAHKYARLYQLPVGQYSTLGRFRKRAFSEKRSQNLVLERVDKASFHVTIDVVLFDDVLTTGSTIMELLNNTPTSLNVLVSVHALAPKVLRC